MRTLWGFLLVASCLWADAPNRLTRREIGLGWILLFDGETLFGWTPDGSEGWRAVDGMIVGGGSAHSWLRTNSSFDDYNLIFEFGSGDDKPRDTLDTSGLPSLPDGKRLERMRWRVYSVMKSSDRFIAMLDTEGSVHGQEGGYAVGEIGLGHEAGGRVEYRSIKLQPRNMRRLFDGGSLEGWNEVEVPDAGRPAVWSVHGKTIHVEGGPGRIETRRKYGEFIMQLSVRVNAPSGQRHPGGGITFGPGKGYEVVIRNEWKGDDRAQAVDFGTGGIRGLQAARRVVSDDNQFIVMTIVWRAGRIGVWVDGYPVASWEDPHPAGSGAGPIGLRTLDSDGSLDFRNVQVFEFPNRPE
jgi:hypothetical protein